MAIEIYLGNPPENIIDWIRNNSQPTGHPETRFTLQGGNVETYNITGTLDLQWMIDNGYWDEFEEVWIKNITQVDIGVGSQEHPLMIIGTSVFSGCTNMTSVTIGNSVTSIWDNAFNGCSELTSVTIGTSVTDIEPEVFYDCKGLTSITIPNSVTIIGYYAFHGCNSITSITFEGKDRATVQGMSNYPFGLNYANESGVTIHCTDEDIQVQYEG